ncbi:MAG: hypothetical protein R3C26_11995 [Calditrichia bacterium]
MHHHDARQMSDEKKNLMRAFGAEVVITRPTFRRNRRRAITAPLGASPAKHLPVLSRSI